MREYASVAKFIRHPVDLFRAANDILIEDV